MVETQVEESAYVNGKYCYEKNIRHLTIVTEAIYVDSKDYNQQPVRKLEMSVSFDLATEKKTKKWQPNKKARTTLEKFFGKETKLWINKKLKINMTPYKDSYSIDIDEMDTRALNQPAGL